MAVRARVAGDPAKGVAPGLHQGVHRGVVPRERAVDHLDPRRVPGVEQPRSDAEPRGVETGSRDAGDFGKPLPLRELDAIGGLDDLDGVRSHSQTK